MQTSLIVNYHCGDETFIKITGSVIGRLATPPVESAAKTTKMLFVQSEGVQSPRNFAGEEPDVLETEIVGLGSFESWLTMEAEVKSKPAVGVALEAPSE